MPPEGRIKINFVHTLSIPANSFWGKKWGLGETSDAASSGANVISHLFNGNLWC
jgi:hypothetical protein